MPKLVTFFEIPEKFTRFFIIFTASTIYLDSQCFRIQFIRSVGLRTWSSESLTCNYRGHQTYSWKQHMHASCPSSYSILSPNQYLSSSTSARGDFCSQVLPMPS